MIIFKNFDGKLTRDEFKQGSKNDPWIVQALTMDAGSGGSGEDGGGMVTGTTDDPTTVATSVKHSRAHRPQL